LIPIEDAFQPSEKDCALTLKLIFHNFTAKVLLVLGLLVPQVGWALPGDVDDNRIVDADDARSLLRYTLGSQPTSPKAVASGDV
jgi:hypothetical protein